jgi:hypothetical protein
MKRMQDADPDAPLDPPMEMRCIDDEFNYLVNKIDEYTGYFMRLQKTMTTTLDRYQACRVVGMQAHMLGRLVHVAEHIGLTIPQVESLQQYIPYLYLMETIMWSATQEIETSFRLPTPA